MSDGPVGQRDETAPPAHLPAATGAPRLDPLRTGEPPCQPIGAESPAAGLTLRQQVAAFEQTVIRDTLARHGNNKSATARALGLTYRGLQKKILRLARGAAGHANKGG